MAVTSIICDGCTAAGFTFPQPRILRGGELSAGLDVSISFTARTHPQAESGGLAGAGRIDLPQGSRVLAALHGSVNRRLADRRNAGESSVRLFRPRLPEGRFYRFYRQPGLRHECGG